MGLALPKPRDIVKEDDIEAWVGAAVRMLLPIMAKETREALVFAMEEHQKILAEQTLAMMRTIEIQVASMRHAVEVQGRTMNRLVAFGGLSGACRYLWQDLQKGWQRWCLAVGYGVGVIAVMHCIQ